MDSVHRLKVTASSSMGGLREIDVGRLRGAVGKSAGAAGRSAHGLTGSARRSARRMARRRNAPAFPPVLLGALLVAVLALLLSRDRLAGLLPGRGRPAWSRAGGDYRI